MSLKLAVDNDSNVAQFPGLNLNEVAPLLEAIASEMRAGVFGTVANATLLIEHDGGLETFHWGVSDSLHERVGLLEAAKFQLLNQLHGND